MQRFDQRKAETDKVQGNMPKVQRRMNRLRSLEGGGGRQTVCFLSKKQSLKWIDRAGYAVLAGLESIRRWQPWAKAGSERGYRIMACRSSQISSSHYGRCACSRKIRQS